SPACWATSTYWTGDVGPATAACTSDELLHFQSGVVRVSSSAPPRTKTDEPRKRRRGKFIDFDTDYREQGLKGLLVKAAIAAFQASAALLCVAAPDAAIPATLLGLFLCHSAVRTGEQD